MNKIIGIVFLLILFSVMISCSTNNNFQMKNPPKHVILNSFDGLVLIVLKMVSLMLILGFLKFLPCFLFSFFYKSNCVLWLI